MAEAKVVAPLGPNLSEAQTAIAGANSAAPSGPSWLKLKSNQDIHVAGRPGVDSRAARGAVSCAGDGSRAALAATPDGEGGGEVNNDGEEGEQNHCTRTY